MKKILIVTASLLLGSSGAWALGTTAGTEIENNATLTYSAGGVVQPEVNTTKPDVFVVDKKIDMVLTTDNTNQVEVTPGQTDRLTAYSFVNEGNADQNFTFTVSNLANDKEADYDEDKDNEDVSDLLIQCSYTAADGTTKTETWAAKFTLEIAKNGTAECNVSADIPSAADGGEDGDIMNVELLATAVDASGNPEKENKTADSQSTVEIVFADGADDITHDDAHNTLGSESGDKGKGDTQRDGKEAARSGYIIQTPVLDVTKTSCVINDPVNGTNNPKRIPGAVIRYMFDINNTGTGDVEDLNLTDTFNDALDLTNTAGSAKKLENQDKCDCTNLGSAVDISADTTINGHDMLIEHINVDAGSTQTSEDENHTCVSVEVEIK